MDNFSQIIGILSEFFSYFGDSISWGNVFYRLVCIRCHKQVLQEEALPVQDTWLVEHMALEEVEEVEEEEEGEEVVVEVHKLEVEHTSLQVVQEHTLLVECMEGEEEGPLEQALHIHIQETGKESWVVALWGQQNSTRVGRKVHRLGYSREAFVASLAEEVVAVQGNTNRHRQEHNQEDMVLGTDGVAA